MATDLAPDATPVTDRFHETSWSANLEKPRHAADRGVVCEAIAAVEQTGVGYHVNLVTHGDHGHPETYLYEALAERFGDEIDVRHVDRCGCGGHVSKVAVDGRSETHVCYSFKAPAVELYAWSRSGGWNSSIS